MVTGVNHRDGGVSVEMSMDPKNGGMWWRMNRGDSAYEKVIHGKTILSAELVENRGTGHRRLLSITAQRRFTMARQS